MKNFIKIIAVLFIGSAATVDMVYFNSGAGGGINGTSINVTHSCNGTHISGQYMFSLLTNSPTDQYQLNLNLTQTFPFMYGGPGNTTQMSFGTLNVPANEPGPFNIPFEFPGYLLNPSINSPFLVSPTFYLNCVTNTSQTVLNSTFPTFIPLCPDPCEVISSNVLNLSDCLFANGNYHVNGTYSFNRTTNVPQFFDLYFNSTQIVYPIRLNNVFVNSTVGNISFSIPGPINTTSGDLFLTCNSGGFGRFSTDETDNLDELKSGAVFPIAVPINNSRVSTSLPICPEFDLETKNIRLNDPCSCSDPGNIRDAGGNITLFHDVLEIDIMAGTTGMVRITTINSGFRDSFNVLYPLNVLISDITTGPTADTIVTFDFYRQSGEVVDIIGSLFPTGGGQVSDPLTSNVCTSAMCAPPAVIPTLGEWGIILLMLSLLILGVVTLQVIYSRQSMQSSPEHLNK